MNYRSQTSRTLHDEHVATMALLDRVEHAFGRADGSDPGIPTLARALARHLDHELGRHFGFEEEQLFPRLTAAGEGDIASLLQEEHGTIRAVAEELLPLVRTAGERALDAAEWDTLRRGMPELVERLVAHIQKETMALLPMLDDVLDEDTDRELSFAYASA
ncbi:MAG: hemerythrin domain-containing protein [Betaproteobacteria bacterium]